DMDQLAMALKERGTPFSGRVSFLHLGEEEPTPPASGVGAASRAAPGPARLAGPTAAGGPGGGGSSGLLSTTPHARPTRHAPLLGHPGVVALAEQVVRCEDSRFADLPSRLLSKTLIVRDLVAARAIHSLSGANFRCVTLAGELLEADGTLTVGTHHAEAGIL